jgi:hypothetical protein
MLDALDILRKLPDGGIVWIETARDLDTARNRIEGFTRHRPGEYVIFSQETQSIVGTPWGSFPGQKIAAKDLRTKKVRGAKRQAATKKQQAESSPALNTRQVIANIVKNMTRTLRRKP